MQQEINFCLLLPEQKKAFLTMRRLLTASVFFIFLLIFQLCLDYWGRHKDALQLNALNQDLTQVERSLALIHERYPMLDPLDLESSLKKLQSEVEEENTLFDLLAAKRNFSSCLLGIAKAAVPDLWLLDIKMEMKRKYLMLSGYAMQAKAIETFMSNLQAQTEFSGLHFILQEMLKTELEKEPVLHFIITTQVNSENKTG